MKFKSTYLALALFATFGFALGACSSGSDSPPEPVVEMPEPMPEPDPGPTDLETTQMAAADAAAAAKAASDGAAAAAGGAEDATANLATLQTGEMAGALAAAAGKYASDAAAAYERAKAASGAAAEADTASAAGASRAVAEAAQAAAEAAAMMAGEKAMAAVEAAGMELHIDGTMASVGDSSVDTRSGELTDTADDGSTTMITGLTGRIERTVLKIDGVPFDEDGTPSVASDDTDYEQAVAQGMVNIGKQLDTTDDMARLVVIDSRAGTKNVRVYGLPTTRTTIVVRTNKDGARTHADSLIGVATSTNEAPDFRSVGTYYEATSGPLAADGSAGTNNGLDAMDVVADGAMPKNVFVYADPTDTDATDGINMIHAVETSRTVGGGNTDVTYMSVDVTAAAAPTPRGTAAAADGSSYAQVGVTAALPAAVKYSHISFGVWANLKANADGDNSALANLGIGFVDSSAEAATVQVSGTATYNGDWVANVRGMHSSAIKVATGSATLTANFSEDEFMGDLMGLAKLEGSLSGNMFSGTKAMVSHVDLSSSGTFEGSFEGAIYGSGGEEAAGVFIFDGGDAGAFVGAFGGRDADQ